MSNFVAERRIPHSEETLWGWWIAAGVLGGTASAAVVAVFGGSVRGLPLVAVSGFVLVATLAAGLGQGLVLRWQVAWAGRWLAASIAGWLLGGAVGGAIGATVFFGIGGWVTQPLSALGVAVAAVVVGAAVGAVVGMAGMQWLVLRGRVSRAGWWFVASVLAWVVAGALVWVQFLLVPVAVGRVVAGAASAGVAGAITGIALIWLLRQPAAAAVDRPPRVRRDFRLRSIAAAVKDLDPGFGLRWMWWSAWGALGGVIAGGLVGLPVGLSTASGWFAGLQVLIAASFGAMVGAAIGIGVAQWRVLRHEGIRRAGWWVLAHCLGWAVGVGLAVSANVYGRLGWVPAVVAGLAVAGLVGGTLQWLVLRGQVPGAAWWVAASTVGYALGGALVVAAASGPAPLWVAIAPLVLVTTGSAMGGILRHHVPVRAAPVPSRTQAPARFRSGPTPSTSTCPHCEEINNVSARICVFCSRDMPARPPPCPTTDVRRRSMAADRPRCYIRRPPRA